MYGQYQVPPGANQGVQWVVIGLTDLYNYLVAPQVDAMNTAALKAGQTDRVTEIFQDVAYAIRRKIQSNLRNQVSLTPNSVPPELKWVNCQLVIEQLQSAITGLALSEDQVRAINRAWNELNRVASSQDVVSYPTDPMIAEDVQRAPPAQVVTASRRVATSRSLSGL